MLINWLNYTKVEEINKKYFDIWATYMQAADTWSVIVIMSFWSKREWCVDCFNIAKF